MGKKRGRRLASCEQCRARKLRCDRTAPCHNCASRGIKCHYGPNGRRGQPSSRDSPTEHYTSHLKTSLDPIQDALTGRDARHRDAGGRLQKQRPLQQPLLPQQSAHTLHHLVQAVSELDDSLAFSQLNVCTRLSSPSFVVLVGFRCENCRSFRC